MLNIWQQERCTDSRNSAGGHRKLNILFCIVVSGLAAGCTTTYIERPRADYPPPAPVVVMPPPAPPRTVYVQPPPVETGASIRITVETDFYEPLSPYGRWEVVAPYGRCWIPARMGPDWRPYSNGHWRRTECGWYWDSDEPWGWATYHYGRWDWRPEFGWIWVPRTEWAPAWVSWHRSDRYVGWAPLHPSARFNSGGVVEVNERVVSPRAYVFVEGRRFLEPVRPANVVVNNTTIINQTVNITNVKVVNKTVINEGPRTEQIEHDSGRKLQVVPVQELRRKTEAPVVARRHVPPSRPDVSQPANPRQPESKPNQPVIASEPRRLESQPAVTSPAPVTATTPVPTPRREVARPVKPRPETAQPKAPKETVHTTRPDASPRSVEKPSPVVATPEPVKASAKDQAAAQKQARAVEKREAQSQKKQQQRLSKVHPKHDQLADEQGKTNLVKKAENKKED